MSSSGGQHHSFVPKQHLVEALASLGFSANASARGLYYTGNNSADAAAEWLFQNTHQDLEAPLAPSQLADSESDSDDDVVSYLDDGSFYKMVFVVNSELAMGVGKIAAQVAHAALELHRQMIEDQQRYGEMLLQWEQYGETKIVLKGTNTAQLQELGAQAAGLHLPHYIVQDAGKTQVAAGSMTVLCIMGKVDVVDQVTGPLPLLT